MQKATCVTPCCCTPSTPPPAPCNGCLYAHGYTVVPSVSTGPCGQKGYIDLAVLNAESSCNGPISYKIHQYDKAGFKNVYIDGTLLRWETSDNAVPNHFYCIYYIAGCAAEDEESVARINIGIKKHCDKTCPEGTKCNPCNGDCVPLQTDLSVEIESNSDLSTSIVEL